MKLNFHQHVDFAVTRGLSRYKSGGSRFQNQAYEFERNLGDRIVGIKSLLESNEYVPLVRCKRMLRRGKARPILLYDIDDYIIQVAVRKEIEPLLKDILFSDSSYGRKRRLLKDDMRDIEPERTVFSMVHRLTRLRKVHPFVLKADIKAFFPSVNRQRLMRVLEEQIPGIATNSVMSGCIAPTIVPDSDVEPSLLAMCPTLVKGIPQGSVLSPLLANCYLFEFDQLVGKNYFRYVDDFAICCDDRNEAKDIYRKCVSLLKSIELEIDNLDTDKCKIVGPGDDLKILGLNSRSNYIVTPVPEAEQRLIEKVTECFVDVNSGQPVNEGLSRILKRVDSTIGAWHSYYAKCHLSKSLRQGIDAKILRIVKENLKEKGLFRASFLGSPTMMSKLGITRLADLAPGEPTLSDFGYSVEEIADWIEGRFDD